MRILGIDPGLCKTGWGLIDCVEYGNPKFISCGTIKTNESEKIENRLLTLNIEMKKIIKENSPHRVAMEDVFINMNAKSSKKLVMARAVLLIAATEKKLNIFEYSPNEIKKNITGQGHATKDLMFFFTKKILNVDILIDKKVVTYDSADALAVAVCHSFSVRFGDV